ncbi:hypothetical protein NMY22_g8463 [Coprinellus aureogranulatus]|nr:hypothetical protein NMY22_g8463 [Coprinellus aureogranulatus]
MGFHLVLLEDEPVIGGLDMLGFKSGTSVYKGTSLSTNVLPSSSSWGETFYNSPISHPLPFQLLPLYRSRNSQIVSRSIRHVRMLKTVGLPERLFPPLAPHPQAMPTWRVTGKQDWQRASSRIGANLVSPRGSNPLHFTLTFSPNRRPMPLSTNASLYPFLSSPGKPSNYVLTGAALRSLPGLSPNPSAARHRHHR